MRKIIILFLIVFSFPEINSQKIEFFKEDINFKLTTKFFYVDGIYHFCNVSSDSIVANLYYPFPEGEFYGKVDSILIINMDNLSPVKYKDNKGEGIFFKIAIDPYGIIKYNIKYVQELMGGRAEYILLSTQSWKKAFEVANYKLLVSKNIKIRSLSYQPDSVINESNNKVYYWNKRDFMPDKNLIIEFESE